VVAPLLIPMRGEGASPEAHARAFNAARPSIASRISRGRLPAAVEQGNESSGITHLRAVARGRAVAQVTSRRLRQVGASGDRDSQNAERQRQLCAFSHCIND